MRTRRVSRINFQFIDRLFQALDHMGIDPTELPRKSHRPIMGEQARGITHTLPVTPCAIVASFPKPEEEMDIRYAMCNSCANTLPRQQTHDPRITNLIVRSASGQESASIVERIRNLPTSIPTPTSSSRGHTRRTAKRPR